MINISYIYCSSDVKDVYHETIEPRYYNYDTTMESLSEMIANSSIQFSPFSYCNNVKSKDSWENDKQNTLWLDFDNGTTLEEAFEWFRPYEYIIYTTKSHRELKGGKVCDRFRVVLKAVRIPTGELYWAMMRELESLMPIDKQVNTPTGAFLGNTGAEVYTNVGKDYDCEPLLRMAEYRLANAKKAKGLQQRKRLESLERQVRTINIKDIKNYLDIEDIFGILVELGYDVDTRRKSFKMREEERTHSAKVYPSGYIYDYGSGWRGDILDVIQDRLGINFMASVEYVKSYINTANKGN